MINNILVLIQLINYFLQRKHCTTPQEGEQETSPNATTSEKKKKKKKRKKHDEEAPVDELVEVKPEPVEVSEEVSR